MGAQKKMVLRGLHGGRTERSQGFMGRVIDEKRRVDLAGGVGSGWMDCFELVEGRGRQDLS